MERSVLKAVTIVAALIFLLTGCTKTTQDNTIVSSESNTITEIPTERHSIELNKDEVNLVALITVAEAEGEPILGKRLVIDTVFNRVETDGFPDDITAVIFQPNAFESIWNRRVDNCVVDDRTIELVLEEAYARTNCEVLYFNADGYSEFGRPLFRIGHHYFSGK